MLESHLFEGNQKTNVPISELKYGVSVTDACIDFPATALLVELAENKLADVLKNRINK